MNNNMNENTKVTKDVENVEETKATEVTETMEETKEMETTTEKAYTDNMRFHKKNKEFFKMYNDICDIVYNELGVDYIVEKSKYANSLWNIATDMSYIDSICDMIMKPFCFNRLIHVKTLDELNLTVLPYFLESFKFELENDEIVIIEEDLMVYLYQYFTRDYDDFYGLTIGDSRKYNSERLINKITDLIKLDLRYTKAQIKVLCEYIDTMLNLEETYHDEDRWANAIDQLIDNSFGNIKPIDEYKGELYYDTTDDITQYDVYKRLAENTWNDRSCVLNVVNMYANQIYVNGYIGSIKNTPIIKLILDECEFTDYEFLKYLYFINFNPVKMKCNPTHIKDFPFKDPIETSSADFKYERTTPAQMCFEHLMNEAKKRESDQTDDNE